MSDHSKRTPKQILADQKDPMKAENSYEARVRARKRFEETHPITARPTHTPYPVTLRPTLAHHSTGNIWFECNTYDQHESSKPFVRLTLTESHKTRSYTLDTLEAHALLNSLQEAVTDHEKAITLYSEFQDTLNTWHKDQAEWSKLQEQAADLAEAEWQAEHEQEADPSEELPY